MYEDDSSVWEDVVNLAVADLSRVQYTGIALDGGEILYPICLGNKGDWSYLVAQSLLATICWAILVGCLIAKVPRACAQPLCTQVTAANLTRSYRHAPKTERIGKNSVPSGLCHLCLAGTPGHDWEDWSLGPWWFFLSLGSF